MASRVVTLACYATRDCRTAPHAERETRLEHSPGDQPHGAVARNARQFHTVICWDRLAETTGAYVKKGDPLYVEGRLEYRSFQDEEGKERGVCEIIASDVGFLGRRPAADGATDTMGLHPVADDVSPEDIPF